MKRHFRWFGPLVVSCIFAAVAWLLWQELKEFSCADFVSGLRQISAGRVAAAAVLTSLYYLILVGYDLLAVRFTGYRLPLGKVALASFTGYACSYNFGALLGGASVRYRLYTLWGIPPLKIAQVVVLLGLTFWVGVCALGGVVFFVQPFPIPAIMHLPVANARTLGVILLSALAVYLGLCAFHQGRPLRILGRRFVLPPFGMGLSQAIVASIDLMTGAGVLYVLVSPFLDIGYWPLLSVYLLSLAAGIFTQVPGGTGVFELLALQLLHPADPARLFAALVVWRAVFYLLPLAVAGVVLGLHELRVTTARRRERVEG
jgi:uncharacterized membrane protein YbhN (UPF0104 family)